MSPDTPRSIRRQFWSQLPFFLWLVVLWMLLWGQFTVLAALTGIVIAVFVTTVFRLPTADLSGRVNLWYGFLFAVAFLAALARGALTVAWQTVAPGHPGTAIVRVPLRVDDDLIMTHAAVANSLVPGSLVVEADRENRVLYLHVIGVTSAEDVERQRRIAQRWEERAVLAVGSRAHVALIRSDAPPVVDRIAAEGGGR
ncbi:Na+/H+ antiporter subunit E [Microbacterium betulae]|uniref:Na+/H+ antiporter subunit E n=1 Tax=Microbacterium betulae TaxID=2981139 RepID=A0AA97FIC9_9MICO|nr:Na+/H+ antiporter subunit E [Microbacterium sp. AB]WOF23134.1 Na+/H+ antiporter subunit E [Microbacterium sp. AB]